MRALIAVVVLAAGFVGLGILFSQQDAEPAAPEGVASPADSSAQPLPVPPEQRSSNPVQQPTPPPTQRPLESLQRSDVAFQGILFSAERGLTNLEALLVEAQAAIAAGDATGYFDLSRIIGNCLMLDAPLLAEADALGSLAEDPEIQQMLDECAPVLAAKPESASLPEWQLDALEQAASAGQPLAALELALEHQSDIEYDSVLELTQAAVQSGDYRGYFLAADFLNTFHDPDAAAVNELRAMNWFYLGCQKSPYCEGEILDRQLGLDYTPAQIDQMREFSNEAGGRLDAGSELPFEAGWLGLNQTP